ncbi:hypothetical protein FISHEDRAFT_69176 [Fistulina hepatica ATCC 64428]|uniref:Type 1 phosphatases regulator n=1 Tax=Fistulina hepatica ATCC 64428 TaxID=1128425 RepID=A0A0D7ANY8_9AGAR|nr:hypothetical protein FISHEDRAFT_69176 [Fistulina hepatica ATCC 64428]
MSVLRSSDASAATTLTNPSLGVAESSISTSDGSTQVGVLRLRGRKARRREHVAWDDSVIDNEGCEKKKSKICCIYHKPRAFDKSSSDESDSSTEDDSSDSDSGRARSSQRFRRFTHDNRHSSRHCRRHDHYDGGQHSSGSPTPTPSSADTCVVVHEPEHMSNAYERAPRGKGKK